MFNFRTISDGKMGFSNLILEFGLQKVAIKSNFVKGRYLPGVGFKKGEGRKLWVIKVVKNNSSQLIIRQRFSVL